VILRQTKSSHVEGGLSKGLVCAVLEVRTPISVSRIFLMMVIHAFINQAWAKKNVNFVKYRLFLNFLTYSIEM
jgi:hypothetical protein